MMDKTNTVSIILPTYNRAGYIRDAIESVLKQTYGNFKLMIVDDGSTDNTEQVVAPYLSDKRVRYMKQPNSGAAAARNYGLTVREGDFVAFIDSDDIWEPEKLGIQVSIMAALPEVALVCSDFSSITKSGSVEESHIRSYFSVFDDYNLNYPDIFSNSLKDKIDGLAHGEEVYWGNIYETMIFGNLVLTSTCLIRSSVMDHVGVFDLRYTTLEDYDLFLKISKIFPIALVGKPLIRYRYSDNQLSGEGHFGALCVNLIEIFNKNIASIRDTAFFNNNRFKLRRHLGKYQAMKGYYHFKREEMRDAANCYRRGLANNPADFKSYMYLFFSLMPLSVSRFIRKMKSKMTN